MREAVIKVIDLSLSGGSGEIPSDSACWSTSRLLLQPLRWHCAECAVHQEQYVREEQHPYMYVARTSNNRVIAARDLYCCLLLQCEALRTRRSGFPIATLP